MELKSCSAVLLKERKSRFYSHLYKVDNIEEIEEILKLQRRKYKKARHHCWAYRIDSNGKVLEKAHDDGEVGAPGKALLEVLREADMVGYLLVVSRVFGGVKLGMGGVRRAFTEAGKGAVEEFLRSR